VAAIDHVPATTATEVPPYPLWHPMTDMRSYLADPVVIVRGEGVTVWDAEGREYLAATSGLWNVSCGYGRSELADAIVEQLGRLPYGTLFRFGNEPALRLAEELVRLAPPGLTRVFYSSSGSAAIEAGLKVARRYFRLRGEPERRLVACLSHSYHGTSIGAMAVTGEELEQAEYGIDRGDVRVLPTPDPLRGVDATGELLALAEREGEALAAIVLEPILGSGGVVVLPQHFHDAVARVCRETGALLIVDEVATGFGRTGRMFGHEWFGLEPDVLVCSKGIDGGYVPLGATLFRDEIFAEFWRHGAVFAHGETQAGNPLACAAALATLDVIEREGLVEHAAEIGEYLLRALRELECYPHVGEVRGRGLMIGVELVRDRRTLAPIDPGHVMPIVKLVAREGVIVHPSPSGISLFPPLVLDRADADVIVDAIERVVAGLALS
jgi:adenosylmethionine-8-amino-7-oxononanoate aminotransferase